MQLTVQEQSKLEGIDYYLWRPVMLQKALLWEMKTYWTMSDLVTFHEMQDIEDALREESYKDLNKDK